MLIDEIYVTTFFNYLIEHSTPSFVKLSKRSDEFYANGILAPESLFRGGGGYIRP